jgi:hypothetical protein
MRCALAGCPFPAGLTGVFGEGGELLTEDGGVPGAQVDLVFNAIQPEPLLTKTRLIRAAGLRWPVEEDFGLGKNCFGLGQCQARLYTAIQRHITLVMAALAICAVTAAWLKDRTDTQAPPPLTPDQAPPADPGLILLTVPEIKRLLAEALARPRPLGTARTPARGAARNTAMRKGRALTGASGGRPRPATSALLP